MSRIAACVIAEAERVYGKIDVLVNAGARTDRGTILDTSPELFDALFAVNVRGPYFLMQEAIRHMIRDGIEGAICNIGSISEHAGQPFINAYCATKAALATLTRNTAFSVMKNRIRVNQLNVGWMASDHERELQARATGDPDWEAKAAATLPFGRLVDPREGGAGGQLHRFGRCRADDGRGGELRPDGPWCRTPAPWPCLKRRWRSRLALIENRRPADRKTATTTGLAVCSPYRSVTVGMRGLTALF